MSRINKEVSEEARARWWGKLQADLQEGKHDHIRSEIHTLFCPRHTHTHTHTLVLWWERAGNIQSSNRSHFWTHCVCTDVLFEIGVCVCVWVMCVMLSRSSV